MKKINCIAIDDEPLALTVISSFCKRKGNINLTTFSEPHIGIENIEKQKPDIVFLDIEMNSINGIEIAKRLPKECVFIFTTAHAKFALEGFNLDAVDFLHKPFAYERFEKAIDKALRRLESQTTQTKPEHIIVKQEYNNIMLSTDDILYIEAMENYAKIYRIREPYILSRTSMKTIMSMLPGDKFVRVHKSYIIPLKNIESYNHNYVVLNEGNIKIPIGRTYVDDFINAVNSYRHQ